MWRYILIIFIFIIFIFIKNIFAKFMTDESAKLCSETFLF